MPIENYTFYGTIIQIRRKNEVTIQLLEPKELLAQAPKAINHQHILENDRFLLQLNRSAGFENWDLLMQTMLTVSIADLPQSHREAVHGSYQRPDKSPSALDQLKINAENKRILRYATSAVCRTRGDLIRTELDVTFALDEEDGAIAIEHNLDLDRAGVPHQFDVDDIEMSIERRRLIKLESFKYSSPFTLWLDLPSLH